MDQERKDSEGQDTRTRILEAAAELVHAQGFNHTGIQQILNRCQVPKGSFYFYFKSKEDLGLKLVDHHMAFFGERAGALLRDGARPPLERLKAFLDWFAEHFRANGYTCGCPLGNLIQEMSDLSPAFRDKLGEAVDRLAGAIGAVIAEAVQRGDCAPDIDPEVAARVVLSGWQGALMYMKLYKSGEPLQDFSDMVFGRLLGK